MPFDGTTKTEIEILDEMVEILATPDKWCQGMYQLGDRRCLAAALMIADGVMRGPVLAPFGGQSPAGTRVLGALGDATAVGYDSLGNICQFNNSHSHQEVLALIGAVRRTFAREAFHAV